MEGYKENGSIIVPREQKIWRLDILEILGQSGRVAQGTMDFLVKEMGPILLLDNSLQEK